MPTNVSQTFRSFTRMLFCGLALLSTIPTSAQPVKPLSTTDAQGKRVLVPTPKTTATVLIFIAHDCPISNSYAPAIQRLAAQYAPRGIAFLLVYAEPGFSAAQARLHAQQYGYHIPILRDSWRTLVRETGVTTTPEAAALSPQGKLLYRGRIDNWFAAYGVQRSAATTHDLQDALEAILRGKPVPQPRTPALGCFIASN